MGINRQKILVQIGKRADYQGGKNGHRAEKCWTGGSIRGQLGLITPAVTSDCMGQ